MKAVLKELEIMEGLALEKMQTSTAIQKKHRRVKRRIMWSKLCRTIRCTASLN